MKKIGLFLCLFFVLLGNVSAETSKDIMIKYKYTDNIIKHTKEIVDNKVEYELNEDKVKLKLEGNADNISILFFEVSKESLEWLKTKVNINENCNIYYLKFLDESNNQSNINITVEETSKENKIIKIYDKNGNELQKASNNCYVVIQKVSNQQVEADKEDVTIYKDIVAKPQNSENNILPLIIFSVILTTIFVILIVVVKTRKDKYNE